jgi:CHAT domain-containing protein
VKAGNILWGYSFYWNISKENQALLETPDHTCGAGSLKSAKILICCLLVVPLVGTVLSSVPKSRAHILETPEARAARRGPILTLLRSAAEVYRTGRYRDAMRGFESTRTAALQAHVPDLAARALGNIGGCQFALHQYGAALESFRNSIREAAAAGDKSAAAVFDANVASLYSEMGELDAAAQWIQGSLSRLNAQDRRQHAPGIIIQLATIRARQQQMEEARRLFSEGIAAAYASDDLDLAANGWNRIGEEYLKQNELAEAEGPLLEAYRIRQLHKIALDSSYRSLGRLRLEQGDLDAASALLDRAVELAASSHGLLPTWDVYHYRGRVRLAQGRLREALDDLRIAVRLAREWRWNVPPEDAARIGAEGMLDQVHSALVEAGNRLYQETGDASLIRETFEAAEENRANSLRALVRSREFEVRKKLPPEYWEALARLQRAEIQALRSAASEQEVSAAREDVRRVESSLGSLVELLPAQLLETVRQTLDSNTALLSVHLGAQASWLWAVDSRELALYELPPRDQIARQVREASAAIRQGRTDSGALARTLFGQLSGRYRTKSRWLLALESTLFSAPLAALTDSAGAPLAASHVIQIIPGAGYFAEAHSREATHSTGLFLGIGDPIYNTADNRLPRSSRHPRQQPLMLPRLVASGAEIEQAALSWNGEHLLLEGADASRENLRVRLGLNPAVVHIATHFVAANQGPSSGQIALSLTPRLENELLTPSEIAEWHTRTGLVVLSGCSSGLGAALPGTGLLGLTRAWLTAGAGAVIASNWPTPDDNGALFAALYRNLSRNPEIGAADALRQAQLDMLRSGTWRANPRYWGAYFAMGAQ